MNLFLKNNEVKSRKQDKNQFIKICIYKLIQSI